MKIQSSELYVNNKKVYHEGNKPRPQDINAADRSHGHGEYLTTGGTAANSNKLSNRPMSEGISNSTIASRDGNGDIQARTLKSNLGNESRVTGAIAFRVNNSSDNYLRYCSDPNNIRNWLGAAPISHSHNYATTSHHHDDRYVSKISDSSMNGNLTLNKQLYLNAYPGQGSGSTAVWYNGNSKTVHIDSANQIYLNGNLVIHQGSNNFNIKGYGKVQHEEGSDKYYFHNGMCMLVTWYSIALNSSRVITFPSGLFRNGVSSPMICQYNADGDWQTCAYEGKISITGWDKSSVTLVNWDTSKAARVMLWVIGN